MKRDTISNKEEQATDILKIRMLSQRSQKQKSTSCMMPFFIKFYKMQINLCDDKNSSAELAQRWREEMLQRAWGSFWGWWKRLVSWLWWWFHRCTYVKTFLIVYFKYVKFTIWLLYFKTQREKDKTYISLILSIVQNTSLLIIGVY